MPRPRGIPHPSAGRPRARGAVSFFAWAAVALLAGDAAGASPTAPFVKGRALVVAVGDYPDEVNASWPDLPGPAGDARRIVATLVGRGFPRRNILVLRDRQATHEAVVRAFHDFLVAPADEETEALFWYCGHGSRVPDRSGVVGAEADGMDSSFVLWDSRVGGRRGSLDFTDDELRSLVSALTERTGRVTLVLDSCHSGEMVRGAGPAAVRTAPGQDGTEPLDLEAIGRFWPEEIPLLDDGDPAPDPRRYVQIAACRPREVAQEWVLDPPPETEPSHYGALTFFLTWELAHADRDTTYRRLFEQTKSYVLARLLGQHPQVEGALDRVLFGGRLRPRRRGFGARSGPRHRLHVEAGTLFGVARGALLEILTPDGVRAGEAEVVDAQATRSLALWKGGVPREATERAWIARVLRPGDGAEPLRVATTDGAVRAALEEIADVRVVDAAAHPQLLLTTRRAEDERVVRLEVRDENGFRVGVAKRPAGGDAGLAERVRRWVDQERRYRRLLALAATPSPLPVTAWLAPLEPDEVRNPRDPRGRAAPFLRWEGPVVSARIEPHVPAPSPRTSAEGRRPPSVYDVYIPPHAAAAPTVRVRIRNDGDEGIFASLLSVSVTRKVEVLWPPEGQTLRVPPGASRGVYFEVDPPPEDQRLLLDRILVVATAREADFHPLVQPGLRGSADGAEAARVPWILRRALTPSADLRGRPPPEEEPFGLAVLDLKVRFAPRERAPSAGPARGNSH